MTTVQVTDAALDEVVLGSDAPVAVDHWATWCAPCRQVAPVLEQLAAVHDGRVPIARVDADANPLAVQQAGVVSIPTPTSHRHGKVVQALIGARPRAQIPDAIAQGLTDAAEETP